MLLTRITSNTLDPFDIWTDPIVDDVRVENLNSVFWRIIHSVIVELPCRSLVLYLNTTKREEQERDKKTILTKWSVLESRGRFIGHPYFSLYFRVVVKSHYRLLTLLDSGKSFVVTNSMFFQTCTIVVSIKNRLYSSGYFRGILRNLDPLEELVLLCPDPRTLSSFLMCHRQFTSI